MGCLGNINKVRNAIQCHRLKAPQFQKFNSFWNKGKRQSNKIDEVGCLSNKYKSISFHIIAYRLPRSR